MAPDPRGPVGEPPSVVVGPLDAATPDRVGLIDARALGLPADLWGGSTAGEIGRLIREMPQIKHPTLRAFFRDLLVLRLDPPVDAIEDDGLFLTRVDKLLSLGELEAARALIRAAGAPEPQRFRREFDIALLTGTENKACRTIEQTPDISPTFTARVFCLARNGEFDVAALTLGTADALGMLEDREEQLLLRFLDPDLFADEPIPPAPPQPSPLEFRLYEAIGERLDTDRLPVAFAFADQSETVGWKTRIRAAERLARAGVLAPENLVTVLSERKPAASGGAWDRARAIQEFTAVTDGGSQNDPSAALQNAWSAALAGGYGSFLSPWMAERLDQVELAPAAQHDAFEIGLWAADPDLARRHAGASASDATLLALAAGRPQEMTAASPLAGAIKRSLSGLPISPTKQRLIDDGRTGHALLQAVRDLSDGAEGDPSAIGGALSLFIHLGLRETAARTALELMLDEAAA